MPRSPIRRPVDPQEPPPCAARPPAGSRHPALRGLPLGPLGYHETRTFLNASAAGSTDVAGATAQYWCQHYSFHPLPLWRPCCTSTVGARCTRNITSTHAPALVTSWRCAEPPTRPLIDTRYGSRNCHLPVGLSVLLVPRVLWCHRSLTGARTAHAFSLSHQALSSFQCHGRSLYLKHY